MRNTLETRLGIFVGLAIVAAVLILETVGGMERFRRGTHLYARFGNVQDLKVGNRVKMAGVEVGRVEDITLTNNKVLVELKLRRNVEVKTDSIASVKFTGLMGQNFVELAFGTPEAPRAEEGQILESKEQPDLSAIMQKMDNVATGVENLTRSFTGDKIDNLLGPLTDFMKANRGPLTAMIANMEAVSRQMYEGKGTVGKLLYDDSLYNTAMNTVSNLQDSVQAVSYDLKATLADARRIVDQVDSGKGTMGKLLKDESLYRESTELMTNLREISQKINQGNGSIGKLVNDQEFYKNAKLTLQKLDKATEGLEDQGPLSIMGLVVNKLF